MEVVNEKEIFKLLLLFILQKMLGICGGTDERVCQAFAVSNCDIQRQFLSQLYVTNNRLQNLTELFNQHECVSYF